jgi:hypothetical protein
MTIVSKPTAADDLPGSPGGIDIVHRTEEGDVQAASTDSFSDGDGGNRYTSTNHLEKSDMVPLSPKAAVANTSSKQGRRRTSISWRYILIYTIGGAAALGTVFVAGRASKTVGAPATYMNVAKAKNNGNKSKSKARKACPLEPTPDVECGNVYNSTATGEEVVVTLGGNLLCDEDITQADGSSNAALTLVGKDAVLDCQGYTISQTTIDATGIDKGSAAAVDCDIFKFQECGLFYKFGVRLENGARMVNCNIQKFLAGSFIINGGKIENSDLSLNRRGAEFRVSAPTTNTVSKISNR